MDISNGFNSLEKFIRGLTEDFVHLWAGEWGQHNPDIFYLLVLLCRDPATLIKTDDKELAQALYILYEIHETCVVQRIIFTLFRF